MDTATNRVEAILKDEFKMANYVDLIREIFSTVCIVSPDKFNKEFSNFSSHVEGSYHVGRYETPDGKKIAIFAVALKQQTYVENSRSTQRSFAKRLIESGNCDAAMIAFYTPNDKEKKWRLSFVRLEYEMKIEEGRLKTEENLTPVKRYSYLVGAGEPCHTAIDRFRIFITDNNSQPTLDDLEEAFSVEAVTKEFFALYCEKFYQLVEYLESNEDFVEESQRCGFTSEQFAKKLMGQIVFLYFLQKKGWLGVGVWPSVIDEKQYKNLYYCKAASSAQRRIIQQYVPMIYRQSGGKYKLASSMLDQIPDDAEELIANYMPGDRNWGSGSRTFLRTLFEYGKKHKGHFYEEYLEPLFYDTLNKNRGALGYSTILHCRIPFLSGGLFEPLDGYDWKSCYFDIPDDVFSNKKDDNDLMADGILDIFDRYNFTMSEDEPMEREVAIDPEMLGKVFENLLEVKDRKSKGAFYTPREIVHFMCQESLINYLKTNLNISEEAVRNFILYGDFYKDSDAEKTLKVADANGRVHYEFDPNRELKISPEIFCPKTGVNRIMEVDKLLQDIRVADPAVGSGAFPLGMLNEIVRARQTLSAYMAISMNAYDARFMYVNERSTYMLKYETIRNCIFAADIEPSAVDIAQLRLWLALVIDDEINPEADSPLDGHKNPLPLPNLECNIICGNSLIDGFEGHNLIPQSSLLGTNRGAEYSWNQMELETLIPKLIDAQDRLFRCDEPMKKERIKAEIAALKDQMIRAELSSFTPGALKRYDECKNHSSRPFVLWQVEFARVFRDKGGFDIVIGNPPYIQLQKSINDETGEKLGDAYAKLGFKTFAKTGDIYCLFYEKGYQLLHHQGTLSFITSNKWMRAGYGEKLRAFFANNTNPILLIDFSSQKIFESATVDVNIIMLQKSENRGETVSCIVQENCSKNMSVYIEQNSARMCFRQSGSWTILSDIEQRIKEKIEAVGTPLKDWNISINRGILTGCNEAFIISTEKKNELITADPKSAEIIRPILRGRDIKRYGYIFADLWLISTFPSRHYDIDDYPAVKAHLLSFGNKRLEQSGKKYLVDGLEIRARKKTNNKWFETQDSINYWNDFSKPKIVYREISTAMDACMVEPGFVLNNKCYMITGGHLPYLLAYFNSKLFTKIILPLANITGGKGEGFLNNICAKLPSKSEEAHIAHLVDLMIKENNSASAIDTEIDSIITDIYGLTKDEKTFLDHMIG